MPRRTKVRTTKKGEVAREKLLDAGERLFSRQDFDLVSIDDITNEAGMAHGLLFHYFKSKLQLYAEIALRQAERLEAIHREPRHEATPDEKLTACLAKHMRDIRSRPASYKFHTRGGASSEVKQIWEDSRQRFIQLILTEYYQIPDPGPHLFVAARAWLGLFDELVLAWLYDPKITEQGVLTLTVELFNDMLGRVDMLYAPGEMESAIDQMQAS